jgi:hypothetical protein
VYHDGKIYEISNYDFNQVNLKVPFFYDSSTPAGSTRSDEVFISLVGDRIIVRYYNRMYVYGLKTKTWSRWESANSILHNVGPLVVMPVTVTQSVTPTYYAGSSLNNSKSVIAFVDGYNTGISEKVLPSTAVTIVSSITTKNYDISDSSHFKKLMWWGADLLTTQEILAYATPIVNSYKVTWYDLRNNTWNSLSGNTWAAPLLAPVTVPTDITTLTSVNRKFVKFRKALRFRQINFQVVLRGDGSPATGPARLFSLSAIVSAKQLVSKQVS